MEINFWKVTRSVLPFFNQKILYSIFLRISQRISRRNWNFFDKVNRTFTRVETSLWCFVRRHWQHRVIYNRKSNLGWNFSFKDYFSIRIYLLWKTKSSCCSFCVLSNFDLSIYIDRSSICDIYSFRFTAGFLLLNKVISKSRNNFYLINGSYSRCILQPTMRPNIFGTFFGHTRILLKFPNFKNTTNFPNDQIITICSY